MEQQKSGDEFEAFIDGKGRIALPNDLAQRFLGKKVSVRISSNKIVTQLKARGITEEEIDRIVAMQREQRENVIKFLLSEGALRNEKAFLKRAKGMNR
jgi:hypothetical protein